ncbi:hypothetical protein BC832DRAFT_89206 [Gaertneriomyces semiglobifer]|nr:hypothetical protein BC832DRAFT_89206 [Gaertneriomyces semiglobifer]
MVSFGLESAVVEARTFTTFYCPWVLPDNIHLNVMHLLGIWEMDIPTGTMHFSGRLATMLGYHPTELEGDLATWDNMVHPAYISRAQALRAAHLSGKSAFYEIEKQIRTKGGEWRWIFNRGKITVRDEKGNPVKMVGAHTDITDRKRAEIALEEKNRQLDLALQQSYQAAQAKTEFLANISHEIRTPLNGIIGLSSVLAETPLSPDQKDLLSSIQECSDGLLMVVNDVLDFSKIEAGKMSLEYNPFNLENCIRSTIYPLQLKAEEKAIEMRIEIEPDTPEWIVGDVFRTRQILNNLIGNAIKFTSQGSVTVHVSAALLPLASETASNALPRPETPTSTEKFADPSTALVSVSTMKPGSSRYRLQFDIIDTGIGIPADKIDRLFKSFSQVDASTSRRFGGTGLGLAICKQLVGMMDPKGGRMWVCSEEGRGSTFSFCYDVDGCDPPNGGDSKNVNGASDDEQHVNGKLRSRNAGSGEYRLSKSPSKVGRVANRLGNHKGHSDQRLVPKTKEKEVLADKIPLTILVAEDNAINQKLALRLLTQLGYTPSLANNGREAVDAVVNHAKAVSGTFDASNSQGAHAPSGTVATNACKPFDLILMDIQMPLMSGIEATAEIRSLPSSLLPEQPIILALTANALTSDKEICLKAGMDGHISKPVRAGDLRAEIERVMSLKRKIELDTDGSSASSGDDVSGASDGPVKEVRIQLHEPGERVRGAVTGIDFSPVPLTGENVVPAKPAYAPESRSRVPFEVEGLATKGAGALESMRVTNESVTPIASVEPPPIPTPDEAVTIPRQATPPTIEVSMGSSDSHDSSIPTTLPDQATSSISADTTNVTSVDSIIHRAWENERLEVDDKGRLSIGTTMATVNDSERKG